MSYFDPQENLVDDNNSTSTPLAAGATWTGMATDATRYGTATIAMYSDVDSGIDGLRIQYSTDGTNWDHSDDYNYTALHGKVYKVGNVAKYFRVVLINGASPQSELRLQTTLNSYYTKPSSHRITDIISTEDDAELMKSILTAQKPNGDFANIPSTYRGNLSVSIGEYGDTPAIDAFARQRFSQPFTIFDSKQLHDKQPLFWDEELGGSATSTHSSVDADTVLEVTANAADYAIRQTKQRFNYQPGKSQLIFMTFRSPQVSGLTKRVGPFDGTGVNELTPNNGVFFECDGAVSWNIAKDGTTEETVEQADWSVDRLDGTGPSEVTLDLDAPQILIIDYEWLGVGRVRVGFVINGIIYYVHDFNHANDPSFPKVYMSTPNLPLRYDIQTDGTNGGQLDHICGTVISEGGIEKTGILRSIETRNIFTNTLGGGTGSKHALCGIRLKDAYLDVSVIPESVNLVIGSNDSFKWELHLNPEIDWTWTYSDLADSSVQFAQVGAAINNNILTDGLILARGGGSTQSRGAQGDLETALRIGSTIAGDRDELVLVIGLLTNNQTVWGCLNFRELL